jgi:hypothetical protein
MDGVVYPDRAMTPPAAGDPRVAWRSTISNKNG